MSSKSVVSEKDLCRMRLLANKMVDNLSISETDPEILMQVLEDNEEMIKILEKTIESVKKKK